MQGMNFDKKKLRKIFFCFNTSYVGTYRPKVVKCDRAPPSQDFIIKLWRFPTICHANYEPCELLIYF
jgi:hypothetical protein